MLSLKEQEPARESFRFIKRILDSRTQRQEYRSISLPEKPRYQRRHRVTPGPRDRPIPYLVDPIFEMRFVG